jgi:VWFA-related protein
MRNLRTTVGVVSLVSVVLGTPACGRKDPTAPLQPKQDTQVAKKATAEEQDHAIKVRVKEVVLPVTVLDSNGEMIFDLTKDKFHIFDNGVEQSIEQFALGGDRLAVALVLETSSHIQMMAPAFRGIGSVSTETVTALEGSAAMITYDSIVDARQPFTPDHDAIEHAISKADFIAPEMWLYDAMSTPVGQLKVQPINFRCVMLIVGESQDHSSDSKLGLVLRKAQLAKITIYAVGPRSTAADLRYGANGASPVPLPKSLPPTHTEAPPRDPMGRPHLDVLSPAIWSLSRGTNEIKNHQLEVAAASTGGVHYRALGDRAIQSAIDKIGGEIHAQYILSYALIAEGAPGFHKVNVTVVRPKPIVRMRPGYFIEDVPDSFEAPIYFFDLPGNIVMRLC